MKTKKFLALLLCAMMVSALFACAQPAAPATDEAAAPAATEAAATEATDAASTEKVQITYSYWGLPDEAASVQAALDTFNASQDRIEVTLMAIPNEEYTTKLNTMAAAGELPDCGIMNENGVLDFATKGLLADVSTMYEGADSKPMDCITFKSDGVPVAYSAANEILILYYNKAMFDAAGIDYPSATTPMTWDEFVATAKLLTLDSKGNNATSPNFDPDSTVQYGCVVDNWTWQLEVWARSNGSGWYSDDGKTCTINDPVVAESIQKVADLTLVDHVMPYYAGLADEGIVRSIVAGNVAMATGGTWNVGTCLATAKNEQGLNYGVARLPVMKNEVTICTAGPQVVFSQGKHQAEAMEFIKWYTQEANNWDSLIATGIWMPALEKYYTDEEMTHKWVDNPNFPDYDSYKAAVVDYARDKAISTSWYYVPHTNEFNTLLRSVLGPVWTGEKTAQEVLNENFDALNDIFLGN